MSARAPREHSTHLPTPDGAAGLTIRLADEHDEAALERLAELDSRPAPQGRILIAEVEGRMLAAISLDDGVVVADPFARSGEAASLLRLRARQLRRRGGTRAGGHSHRRRGRGSLASSPPGAGGRLLVLPPR